MGSFFFVEQKSFKKTGGYGTIKERQRMSDRRGTPGFWKKVEESDVKGILGRR